MTIDPIVRTITVPRSPEDSFRLFTAGMRGWWPSDTHGRAEHGRAVEDIVFEERVGGRVFERFSDGTEGHWAQVLTWEPPRRVVLAWKPVDDDRSATEVEVTFERSGDGSLVRLEHRGWERLGPKRATQAHDNYANGWVRVFDECFGDAAGVASTASR